MSRWIGLVFRIAVVVAVVAVGLWLGARISADSGYVLFAYGSTTVEMSLWTFVGGSLLLVMALWLVIGVLSEVGRAPFWVVRSVRGIRHRRADSRLVEGALWLRRDQPDKALALLKQSSKSESLPALHWLLASEACRRLDRMETSNTYLQRAEAMMAKVPAALPEPVQPDTFDGLVKVLKKRWNEAWAWSLDAEDRHDPLARLTVLNGLLKEHKESLALAVVMARTAHRADLSAEALHHQGRAQQLDREHPLVLCLEVELAVGSSAALNRLRQSLLAQVA